MLGYKARLIMKNEMWYGEVWVRNLITHTEYWLKMTDPCFTKLGAKIELRSKLMKEKKSKGIEV